jgi:hypothetical protein
MKPLLRTLGVAVLALALMNASAGLCFCHRGPTPAGDSRSAGGCCHETNTSGSTAVKGASSCCHIESAESAATPIVAVQLVPPAAAVTALIDGAPATGATAPVITTVLIGTSPPLFALRI